MDYQQYLFQNKELQLYILKYIDNESDFEDDFEILINFLEKTHISNDRKDLYEILLLLLKITNHHHRYQGFYDKINQIIKFLKENIKQTFSNLEIFNIFKKNLIILHCLFENEILVFDYYIIRYLYENNGFEFFWPEIKKDEKIQKYFNDKITKKFPKNYEEIRKNGENDSYICQLIRNDSIQEFIVYVNKNLIPLSMTIEKSIFETNNFLIKHVPSLIEYAAFYGSIQIFNYIRLNNDSELKPSLWYYAIHSNNAELIHLLEEIDVKVKNEKIKILLKEAIKCHHNEIADYFLNKFGNNRFNNSFECGFHYYNYNWFPNNCERSYLSSIHEILNFLLKQPLIEIGENEFKQCEKLVKIRIPSTIKTIKKGTFQGCIWLKEIKFENNSELTTIEDNAFICCISLTEITIPSNITFIGKSAFENCKSLEKIIFEDLSKLEFVGIFPFYGCTALKEGIEEIQELLEDNSTNNLNYLPINPINFIFPIIKKKNLKFPEQGIKITLFGESNVGKTCIARNYVGSNFIKPMNTIAAEFYDLEINIYGEKNKIGIWDTSGNKDHQALIHIFLHDVNIIYIVFDLNNRSSFEDLDFWFKQVLNVNLSLLKKIYLIGNKCDLERKVSIEEAEEYAFKRKVHYFEVSAKTNKGIDEIKMNNFWQILLEYYSY